MEAIYIEKIIGRNNITGLGFGIIAEFQPCLHYGVNLTDTVLIFIGIKDPFRTFFAWINVRYILLLMRYYISKIDFRGLYFMGNKSFSKLAEEVIREVYGECSLEYENLESTIKRLRRRLDSFFSVAGGSLSEMKGESRNLMFDDMEIRPMRALLSQVAKQEGPAYDFMQKWKNADDVPDLESTMAFVQNLAENITDETWSDEEIQALVNKLDAQYMLSLRILERSCHQMINSMMANMMTYIYPFAVTKMIIFERELKKLFARILAEGTMDIVNQVNEWKMTKELNGVERLQDLISVEPDSIDNEYDERDQRLLSFLNANPDVKRLVENKVGIRLKDLWREK